MKRKIFFFIFCIYLSSNCYSQIISNEGNDFWLGFGYHDGMNNYSGSSSEAKLSLYISSNRNTTVIVEMPGESRFKTISFFSSSNTVQEITGFPTGDPLSKFNPNDSLDSRLYYTGISNRAIHVYTIDGAPISVWMYSYYKNNSAAGSMLFPTNTWNTSYSVQAYGNSTNTGIPNSFFFIIPEEDNTEIDFTPAVDILDSLRSTIFTKNPRRDSIIVQNPITHLKDTIYTDSIKYKAGLTYHIKLNRGQVFNAMGNIIAGTGLDLSGTVIRSTNCKRIAVFGGNGRCLVDLNIPQQTATRTGSDNLIQQMFPKVTWGTKYYTVPTKHMEYNLFRINVSDPGTKIWINDPGHTSPLPGLVNNYYEYQTNVPSVIESDRPVSVTQFIASQAYGTGKVIFGSPSEYGMNGIGDPEMIILSPAQQAINNVTVYSPSFKNGLGLGGGYINVVLPEKGISSFKLDPLINLSQLVDTGSSSYDGIPYDPAPALIPIKDAFKPYSADSNYYWAKFKVDFPAQHTLISDIGFNAIAYGTDDGESYGFNAGTQVKDLSIQLVVKNPYRTNNSLSSIVATCTGTKFKIGVALPFLTDKITFAFGGNIHISPNTDTTLKALTGNLAPDSSLLLYGVQYYVYSLPNLYSFDALGSFPVSITFNASGFDPCFTSVEKTILYTISVIQEEKPVLKTITGPDNADTTGIYVYSIEKTSGNTWEWISTSGTVSKTNNSANLHWHILGLQQPLKVIETTQFGCFQGDTLTKYVNVYPDFTFTGNGDWNSPANWANNAVPPIPLPNGITIHINPLSGECIHYGLLKLPADAKLTVEPGKAFRVIP